MSYPRGAVQAIGKEENTEVKPPVPYRTALRWALLDASESAVVEPLYAKAWFRRAKALHAMGDVQVAEACEALAHRLHGLDEGAAAEASLRSAKVLAWLQEDDTPPARSGDHATARPCINGCDLLERSHMTDAGRGVVATR